MYNNILIFENEIIINELSLFSLERLGILSLDSTTRLKSKKHEDKYKNIENHHLYSSATNALPVHSREFTLEKVRLVKGKADLTPYEKAFVSCVI